MKGKRCFLWFKHKIKFFKGEGYKCSICGKPKSQCGGDK